MTLTASEMGTKSWEARIKKHGKKKARQILLEAAKKGAAKTNAIKRAKKAKLDKTV